MSRPNRAIGLISVVGLCTLVAGCTCSGGQSVTLIDPRTDHHEFETTGISELTATIDAAIGKVVVTSGAAGTIEADVEYNVAEWEPDVEFTTSGGKGTLLLKQRSASSKRIPNGAESEWRIALPPDVPLVLELDLGIGETDLDLGNLGLTRLEIEAGIGSMTIDLRGNWENDVEVDIEGGIGSVDLRLPTDVGVKLKRDVGIGSISVSGFTKKDGFFVNESYGETDVQMNINVEAGIGEISIASAERVPTAM